MPEFAQKERPPQSCSQNCSTVNRQEKLLPTRSLLPDQNPSKMKHGYGCGDGQPGLSSIQHSAIHSENVSLIKPSGLPTFSEKSSQELGLHSKVESALSSSGELNDLYASSSPQAHLGYDFSRVKIYASRRAMQPAGLMAAGPIQAKLAVSQPGDEYEREADRIAIEVVHWRNAHQYRTINRLDVPHENEEKHTMKPITEQLPINSVQHSSNEIGLTIPQDIRAEIKQACIGGQSLPYLMREPMEQAIGAKFSNVKIHIDALSARLNKSFHARAFTIGQNIFFQQGAYNPANAMDQKLLAHELTHVLQQQGSHSNMLIQFDAEDDVREVLNLSDAQGEETTVHELEIIFSNIQDYAEDQLEAEALLQNLLVNDQHDLYWDFREKVHGFDRDRLLDLLENSVYQMAARRQSPSERQAQSVSGIEHVSAEGRTQTTVPIESWEEGQQTRHHGLEENFITELEHPPNEGSTHTVMPPESESRQVIEISTAPEEGSFSIENYPSGAVLTYRGTRGTRRIFLDVAPEVRSDRQPFAHQYLPPVPGRDWPVIRLVVAPGVYISREGFPSAFVPSLENPDVEIYRVQNPDLVPEQDQPILPFEFIGETEIGVREAEHTVTPADVVVNSRSDGVDIAHLENRIILRITAPQSSESARFAYEVIRGESLQVRHGQPTIIRVVKTPSTQVRVFGGTWPGGFADPQIEVYNVPEVTDVPSQGQPLMNVVHERGLTRMTRLPASPASETPEHSALLMNLDIAIGLLPYFGDIADIEEFLQAAETSRDRWGRSVSQTDIQWMGIGSMIPFLSGGALADISSLIRTVGRTINRTPDEAMALLRAASSLPDGEREAIERSIREAQQGDQGAIEALQQMADRQGHRHIPQLTEGVEPPITPPSRQLTEGAGPSSSSLQRPLLEEESLLIEHGPRTGTYDSEMINESRGQMQDMVRALRDSIPEGRARSAGTIAVGLVLIDGDYRFVYTVVRNRFPESSYEPLRIAAEQFPLTRWEPNLGSTRAGQEGTSRLMARGPSGAALDAEQLLIEAAEQNDARVLAICPSITACPGCRDILSAERVVIIPHP